MNQRKLENTLKETITTQHLWDAGKAVLTGKCVAVYVYIRKEKSQINNLTLHHKKKRKNKIKAK